MHEIRINTPISKKEVPDLREQVGWERRESDYPLLFDRCNFWAGVRNKKDVLIGFGYVAGTGLEHGYLEDIIIHPAYQNRGIGEKLVKELLKEADRFGLDIVTVSYGSKHSGFYERCGFFSASGGVWRRRR